MHRTFGPVRSLTLILLALGAICIARLALAQPLPAARPNGSNLTVYLITIEPGDEPYERFGHDAIIIQDDAKLDEYDFGIFDFDAPNFIGNFILGKMTYSMDVYDGEKTIRFYKRDNRSIWLDELNFTPEQRLKLKKRLDLNSLEENKFYRYDYFLDNCTTRVRDALDDAVDGQIHAQLAPIQADRTFRWYTRVGMANYLWLLSGLELSMGPQTDRKLSAWDDCFLPARLMNWIGTVSLEDASGTRRPLVKSHQPFYRATRPPLPDNPPNLAYIFLPIGVIIGSGLVYTARKIGASPANNDVPKRKSKLPKPADHPWARRSFAALAIGWSLFAGLAALFMLFAWFCTDHTATYRNQNLFQFTPLSLALLLMAPSAAFSGRFARYAELMAWTVLSLAASGVLVKILPTFRQWNWEMIALALPAHAGLAIAIHLRNRDRRTSPIANARMELKR